MHIAKAVVDSPLIKTMAFGADPNVGRILMAIGKCVDCRIDPSRTSADIQGIPVIRSGMRAEFEESEVRSLLQTGPIEIRISLGIGAGRGMGIGCDLTEGYVEENAAYASS
jgi:glutamate N-acetyltransferase/amino-acid N-acetyltransferase